MHLQGKWIIKRYFSLHCCKVWRDWKQPTRISLIHWRNHSRGTYSRDTFHINKAPQLTNRATFFWISFDTFGNTLQKIQKKLHCFLRFLCLYYYKKHVCQSVVKHVKNICHCIVINTIYLTNEKLPKFIWQKFSDSLNKMLNNKLYIHMIILL